MRKLGNASLHSRLNKKLYKRGNILIEPSPIQQETVLTELHECV